MKPEWSPEEEAQAKRFAQTVVERGMAMPAVLFLESVRPLHFIGGQFLHFLAPLSGLVVRRWDLDQLGNFLEHRGAVSFVVDEIQRLDRQQRDARRRRKGDSVKHVGAEDGAAAAPDDSRHPGASKPEARD